MYKLWGSAAWYYVRFPLYVHVIDNDELASLVAELIHADMLILLTDIDGIYDGILRIKIPESLSLQQQINLWSNICTIFE
jgi:acetylglutamate kinase